MIDTKLHEGVFAITLNRPESLNAFTPEMLQAMSDALSEAQHNSDVKAVVIEGAGRAFSAGVDLKVLQGIEPQAGKIGDVFDDIANSITRQIRQHRVPIIAKVHGACFTGALEIALSCDFILADKNTKFGDTHAKWGLRPTWGMGQNLARAVGVRRARQLSYTAAVFSGEQAYQWGLVNEIADGSQALSELVNSVCQQIGEASQGAVNAYKELYLLAEQQRDLDSALAKENAKEFTQIDDTQTRLSGFGN